METILGAADFEADTAERYGWINRALPDAELDGFVTRLARRIASFPADAVRSTKAGAQRADHARGPMRCAPMPGGSSSWSAPKPSRPAWRPCSSRVCRPAGRWSRTSVIASNPCDRPSSAVAAAVPARFVRVPGARGAGQGVSLV